MRLSVAIYSPNPHTIRLISPAVAGILPAGTKIAYLADYGARDIADAMDSWRPLFERGLEVGLISWLEFDGCLMLAQGWSESLYANVKKAAEMGIQSVCFNHWRVRSLEHNARAAAESCFDLSTGYTKIMEEYSAALYGTGQAQTALEAYAALEEATLYAKQHNYNIGFTSDWVFYNSSDMPGYHWSTLRRSAANYRLAANRIDRLAACSHPAGRRRAAYLRDLCRISALHFQAVEHLQNAKLPLVGYKAWPLGNPRAAWPAPEALAGLLEEARWALALEEEYMRVFSTWVETCDEQGQLAMHQLGVIEPFAGFMQTLDRQLELELERNRDAD